MEIARLYGLNSITTRSFQSKLSTSRQFGLIETSNQTIQLTDLAKRVLYPTSNNIDEVKYECFAVPPLYTKLIEEFNGKALPVTNVLGNILFNSYKISKQAKDVAAKFFIKNAEDFGYIRGGVLDYSLQRDENFTAIKTDVGEAAVSSGGDAQEEVDKQVVDEEPIIFESNDKLEYITQNVPTESGQVAQIKIPLNATEEDLWIIRDTLDIIMKRKFKIQLGKE